MPQRKTLLDLLYEDTQDTEVLAEREKQKVLDEKIALQFVRELSAEVVAELVARDPAAARIHESISAFHEQVKPWHEISERAILETRELAAP